MSNSEGWKEVGERCFQEICIDLLEEGYREMLREKDYDKDWNEEKLSKHLYSHIKDKVPSKDYPYVHVEWETHHISSETKEVGRIDFKVLRMQNPVERTQNFLECKRLSFEYGVSEYGENGVYRFVKGKYAEKTSHRGMMVGYVLVEDIDGVIKELKSVLSSNSDLMMKKNIKFVESRSPLKVYRSEHRREGSLEDIDLTHVFLRFN